MKASLKQIRPSNWKEHPLSSNWMIIDWDGDYFKKHAELKPEKAGGCCVYTLENQPDGINISLYSVSIHSDAPMGITSLGLRKNAWRPEQSIGQCDALLFPTSDNNGDAFLLVKRSIVRMQVHGKIIKKVRSNRLPILFLNFQREGVL